MSDDEEEIEIDDSEDFCPECYGYGTDDFESPCVYCGGILD